MNRSLILIIAMFGLSTLVGYAQTEVDVQSCLLKAFSENQLQSLSADELAYEKYYVENSFLVLPVPKGKPEGTFETKKIKVDVNVCIYDLNIEVKVDKRTYFISKNKKLVTVYSEKEIKRNYESNK
jgi:hypothetical protein